MTPDPFSATRDQLVNAIAELEAMNADKPTRSRELSLAITNLQQGLLWLDVAPVTAPED